MSQPSHQKPDEVQNAAKAEPSSPAAEAQTNKGRDNPATPSPEPTAVHSNTPENALGTINPSSPEDANATPGSTTLK